MIITVLCPCIKIPGFFPEKGSNSGISTGVVVRLLFSVLAGWQHSSDVEIVAGYYLCW